MEEMDISSLLDKFNNVKFKPIERIILSHDGTVVTLLSMFFNEHVNVDVVAQSEWNGNILRKVEFATEEAKVGEATSIIPLDSNSEKLIDEVRKRNLGLGQTIKKLEYRPNRVVLHIDKTQHKFWRVYNLHQEGSVDILIMEEFYANAFEL